MRRNLIPDFIEDNKNFYYLLGAFKGDGNYNHKQNKIHINVIDLDFLEYIKKIVNKLMPSWKIKIYNHIEAKGNSKKQWRITLTSKDFFIKKLYDLEPKNKEEKIEYLKGLFDSEGCIFWKYETMNMSPVYSKRHKKGYKHLQRNISFSQSSHSDLIKWSKWLKRIGIENTLHLKNDGRSNFIIKKTNAIKEFHRLINFRIQRKKDKLERLMPLLFRSYKSISRVKIKSIKRAGYIHTYDLKVPYYNNFILGNGIITHNSGKTTLQTNICAWIAPNMDLNDICFNLEGYIKKLQDITQNYYKYKLDKDDHSLEIDEGAIDLFSRESLTTSNKVLAKSFFVQRFLNIHVGINIPYYWMLDTIVRDHRIKTLIIIKKRGKYKCITGKGIKRINKLGKKDKDKDLWVIPIPYGFFFEGDFTKDFPKTISTKEYEKYKYGHIKKFLEEARLEATTVKMIKVGILEKELGVKRDTIITQIHSGEIEGRKIGNQWFITKRAYEKLMMA